MGRSKEIDFEADQVVCYEGQEEQTMYKIISGKLMICLLKKSQVTPVAYLEEGEFFGEMSFFDNEPRSATAIAIEPTTLKKFSKGDVTDNMPAWMITLAQSITRKIKISNDLIRNKGIKKQKSEEGIAPLSIEDQGKYFRIIKDAKGE